MKRIGLLATGSEIVRGEILNTNGQAIADALSHRGMSVGEHLSVDDQEAHIHAGLTFLAERHDAVIVTGGLGPTSDDRTRVALAAFLQRPLVFDNDSWQRIEARFAARNRTPTNNNRQQSHFPEGASIFPNPHGTADGCGVSHHQKLFFLLPGPPQECLPLFEAHVLPRLESSGFPTGHRLYRWVLTDVSESVIAHQLDPFGEKHGIAIAYRAAKPQLHIKVLMHPSDPIDTWIHAIETLLAPHPFTRAFPT